MADSPPDDLGIMSVRTWDSRFEGARDRGWVIIITKRGERSEHISDPKSG